MHTFVDRYLHRQVGPPSATGIPQKRPSLDTIVNGRLDQQAWHSLLLDLATVACPGACQASTLQRVNKSHNGRIPGPVPTKLTEYGAESLLKNHEEGERNFDEQR